MQPAVAAALPATPVVLEEKDDDDASPRAEEHRLSVNLHVLSGKADGADNVEQYLVMIRC